MNNAAPSSIIISACTFRRPEGLKDLLHSLSELETPENAALTVRIIDNDEAASAREIVADFTEKYPYPLSYVHEPDPGLSPARNRALAEARGADFLAFVDDDETVPPHWIKELWRVQQNTGATFVQGPFIPTVVNDDNQWWLDTVFFKQKTYPDETPRHEGWTNNVLMDMTFIRRHDISFDMGLRFEGGEDTLFFQDIVRNGGRGAFAANAPVYEAQPASRLNWQWAWSRQFRYGITRSACALMRQKKTKAVVHCLMRAGAMIAVGILTLPLSLVKGRRGFANASAYIVRGCGVLWGVLGKRHMVYQRQAAAS